MKQHTITTYSFNELSQEAQETAKFENLRNLNVDYEWYGFIYDDAEQIGLRITAFDLGVRDMTLEGSFTSTPKMYECNLHESRA